MGSALRLVVATAVALSFSPAAAAQSSEPPPRLVVPAESPRQLPPSPAQKPAEKPRRPPRAFRWEEHPTWHPGSDVSVAFRARFQTDLRRSEGAFADPFDVPLKRVGVQGDLGGIVNFQIDHEIDDPDRWKDVWIGYRQFEAVQVQAGKFKLPIGLDQNQGITTLDFVFRSFVGARLAPGRDRGVMVSGRVARGIVRYDAGVFQHDGRNARATSPERVAGGRTRVGHVAVLPFRTTKTALEDLLIGGGYATSELGEGFSSLRGRSMLGEPFFQSELWVKGQRERLAFELRWRPGPFSVRSEWMRVTDTREGQSVEDTDLSPLLSTAWYVAGSWAITGEAKADGLERPKRPLFHGGAGAIEVAARLDRHLFRSLAEDDVPSTGPRADVVEGNSERALTVGVNWHPNRWVKVQINFIRETIADPLRGPLADKASFWSRVLRFQLNI